ncbi:thermonuclease family protein [Vogesella oryzae]|uniref:thermonuclease family protein n=1 Tax=Vogesella oryzae TaxID=1735285 RepID=UPI001583DA9C|nr:thermonuclease family protein [Vogesella oryzae]
MSINRRQLAALNTLFSNAAPARKLVAALVLLAAIVTWFYPSHGEAVAGGSQIMGTVVAIADGDTLTVLDQANQQHKIRFAFIDAPEKAQPYGQSARQALSAQVFRQPVRVEVIEQDRYGRNVGRVWRQDQDINLLMVQQGYAWHYRQYAQKTQSGSDFAHYEAAQQQAAHSRLGLWQQAAPQAPWEWRRNRREAG